VRVVTLARSADDRDKAVGMLCPFLHDVVTLARSADDRDVREIARDRAVRDHVVTLARSADDRDT
jgi:hypothetical protein